MSIHDNPMANVEHHTVSAGVRSDPSPVAPNPDRAWPAPVESDPAVDELLARRLEDLDTESEGGSDGNFGSNGKNPSSGPDSVPIFPISPKLDEAALHGLAGDYVRDVASTTEAHPAGVLATVLVGVGVMVGHRPYVVSGERHHANTNGLIVGNTGKARKGTAIGVGRRLLLAAEEGFEDRIRNGFGSGEALVGTLAEGPDHRLLIEEHEMSRILKTSARQGSVLSEIVRDAFDGRTLRHNTLKSGALVARGAHVGIVGSITRDELLVTLADVDVANGFINRFMIVAVGRQAIRPRVRPLEDRLVAHYAQRLNVAVREARQRDEVPFSTAGGEAFDLAYEQVTTDDPDGPLGSVIARADAHLARLTLIYALLDRAPAIEPEHVRAALAFWNYCRASAAVLWPEDPLVDRLARSILAAGPEGLTRTEIRAVVGSNNVRRQVIEAALERIAARELAVRTFRSTGGRRAEVWVATAYEEDP